MAAVEQHHVVTGVLQDLGAVSEVVGHHVHVLLGHAVDVDALLIGLAVEHALLDLVYLDGAPGLPALGIGVGVGAGEGDHAAVVQLVAGQGTAGVDGTGDLCQLGLVFGGAGEAAGVGAGVLPVNGGVAQSDNGIAALGLFGVKVDHGFIGTAVEVHVAHHVRGHKKTVFEGGPLDGQRFKQMRIIGIHKRETSFSGYMSASLS